MLQETKMNIIKIVHTEEYCLAFTDIIVRENAKQKQYIDQAYVDWANFYAKMFGVPRGTLFISIYEAKDELDVMAKALKVMEDPRFGAYCHKYKK